MSSRAWHDSQPCKCAICTEVVSQCHSVSSSLFVIHFLLLSSCCVGAILPVIHFLLLSCCCDSTIGLQYKAESDTDEWNVHFPGIYQIITWSASPSFHQESHLPVISSSQIFLHFQTVYVTHTSPVVRAVGWAQHIRTSLHTNSSPSPVGTLAFH